MAAQQPTMTSRQAAIAAQQATYVAKISGTLLDLGKFAA